MTRLCSCGQLILRSCSLAPSLLRLRPISDALDLVSESPTCDTTPRVLLVGPLMGVQVTAGALARCGLEVITVVNGEAAMACVREMPIQVVVLDAAELGGEHDLLSSIKQLRPGVEVVLLASIDTVELALEGVQRGAFDFLVGQGSLALAIKVREALAAVHNRSRFGEVF